MVVFRWQKCHDAEVADPTFRSVSTSFCATEVPLFLPLLSITSVCALAG